jgi:hypothetical protein
MLTSTYDFLHLLIKSRPSMDFGGDLALAHICHNTFFLFLFLSKNGERLISKDQNKR